VQALVDLCLGTLAQIPIALLDQPDQFVVLARNLLEVALDELIPPPS
jgi:hypothetical protein